MSESEPERELLERERQIEFAHRLWWIGVLRGVVALAPGVSALLVALLARTATHLRPTEGQR